MHVNSLHTNVLSVPGPGAERDAKINVILVSIIAPIVTESTNHCTRLADPRPTKDQLKIADRI